MPPQEGRSNISGSVHRTKLAREHEATGMIGTSHITMKAIKQAGAKSLNAGRSRTRGTVESGH